MDWLYGNNHFTNMHNKIFHNLFVDTHPATKIVVMRDK